MAGKYNADTDEIDCGTYSVGAIQSFTMIVSVYFDGFGGSFPTDPRIWSKSSGTAENAHDWMLSLVEIFGNNLRTRLKAGGTTDTNAAPDALSSGQWYLIIFSYDGTDIVLDLDDSEILNSTHSVGGNMDATSNPVYIGNNEGADKAPNASIAEASLLSQLLSATQKTALNSGVCIFGMVPISEAYYPLILNNTTTTPDFSSNGRNGTISSVTKSNHPQVEQVEVYL